MEANLDTGTAIVTKKFGPRVSACRCVGLCEYVQHLAIFDYIAVSGSLDGRVVPPLRPPRSLRGADVAGI